MNFQRILLILIFTFSIYTLWDGWQKLHNPVANPNVVSDTSKTGQTPAPVIEKSSGNASQLNGPLVSAINISSGETIVITTDFIRAEINTLGGDVTKVELLKHFDTDDKTKPFVIFQNDLKHKYIAQSGLLGDGLPTHNTIFTSKSKNYELSKESDFIEVRLSAATVNGVSVNKIFKFHKSSYLIDVSYSIDNKSKSVLEPSAYFQLVRDDSEPSGGSMFVPTYTGSAFYTSKDKFQKIDFPSIEKSKATPPANSDNGWVGMLQHYFVSAWIPKGTETREFYTKKLGEKLYSAGLIIPVSKIESGSKSEFTVPLYVGPAQSKLDDIADGLGLTVDYGFLTIIAKPIFWLLTFIHGFVNNWGVAIILLTVLIKLAFFPLSAASYRSMAKMRVVAPKLTKIREQYSHDRDRLNKAMMELYKTEKINPLGGCLPVVIQIPVFISLYWSILSSVEMRYAPFFGWITDLSKLDPYYVLPIIMGVSMMIQTKLNPTPPDPMQAKMMQIMPIVFSVVFFFFPAGLVLYSIVNNVLSILQQWYITRTIEIETKGANKV